MFGVVLGIHCHGDGIHLRERIGVSSAERVLCLRTRGLSAPTRLLGGLVRLDYQPPTSHGSKGIGILDPDSEVSYKAVFCCIFATVTANDYEAGRKRREKKIEQQVILPFAGETSSRQ